MVIGRLRTALFGIAAWLGGYVATLLLVVADVAGSGGPLGGAARTFLAANAVLLGGSGPAWLVIVPVVALALAGFGVGRSTTGGLVGRLRGLLATVRPSGRSAARRAAVAGVFLAAGYGLTGAVAAVAVGEGVGSALVSGLLLGLVVAVPAAVLAARR